MRIKAHGNYLLIAPEPKKTGYVHSISEREFLVQNIQNFLGNNPDVKEEDVTIYELTEVNQTNNTKPDERR